MPYNPGSAYPRQTTWTPHVRGWDRKPAVGAPNWEPVKARAVSFSGYGSAFARNQASAAGLVNSPVAGPAMTAFNRPGIMDQVRGAQREQAGLRQNRQATRRASAPANPTAVKAQDEAESVVEQMAGDVISNSSNGTATAPASIIIPPWRSGSRRR
jgi:hypothetical protein